jgi:glycosyltransferase involved in cell wall biosynthesis
MSKRIVSIIIPTYNRAYCIKESIDSALSQSYSNVEIIIIDDGSTDNTKEILAPYINKKQITYIYQENTGNPGFARNTGIALAKGEYIAFLDSDDIFHKESIRKRVEFLQDNPGIGFVFTDYDIFHNLFREANLKEPTLNKRIIGFKIIEKYGQQIDHEKLLIPKKCIFDLLLCNFICTPTVMVRKHLLEGMGMFDEQFVVAEDHDLWTRLLRICNLGYINKPLLHVRIHNSITKNKLGYIVGNLDFYKKHYKILPMPLFVKLKVRRKIGNWYFSRGYFYFLNKKFPLATKDFFRAFYFNPFKLAHIKCFLYALLPNYFLISLTNFRKY